MNIVKFDGKWMSIEELIKLKRDLASLAVEDDQIDIIAECEAAARRSVTSK